METNRKNDPIVDFFADLIMAAIDRKIEEDNKQYDFLDKQCYLTSVLVETYKHLSDAEERKRGELISTYRGIADRLKPILQSMEQEAKERGYA